MTWVLTVDVEVSLDGAVRCNGQAAGPVSLRLHQNRVPMLLYASPASTSSICSRLIQCKESAAAAAASIRLTAQGILLIDGGGRGSGDVVTEPKGRFWVDHEWMYLQTPELAHMLSNSSDVCSALNGAVRAADASPVVYSIVQSNGTKLFIPARARGPVAPPSPLMSALAHADTVSLVEPQHTAPLILCSAGCAVLGYAPRLNEGAQLATLLPAIAELADSALLPERLAACVWYLRESYGTCSEVKVDADAEFAKCAQLPADKTMADLPDWWTRILAITVPSTAAASDDARALYALLDCDTYIKLKRTNCECAPAATQRMEQLSKTGALPLRADAQSLLPGSAQMGCLATPIGDASDTGVTNALGDQQVVAARLVELGYLDATSAADTRQREHATRVFACGVAKRGSEKPWLRDWGVDFETGCDVGIPGACRVNGLLCPLVSSRQTCLVDVPCNDGRVIPSDSFFGAVGGTENHHWTGLPPLDLHSWLRSPDAPAWVELSDQIGVQLSLEAGSTISAPVPMFGTSWLERALRLAGRLYAIDAPAQHPTLRVVSASSRAGGIGSKSGQQTGMRLSLELPGSGTSIDEAAAVLQLQALAAAGFVVGDRSFYEHYHPDFVYLRPPMYWQARVLVPDIVPAARVPLIRTAAVVGAKSDHVDVLLHGLDFGESADDILAAGVGGTQCKVIEHASERMLMRCPTATDPPQIGSGAAWLTTRRGGNGVGCDMVEEAFDGASLSLSTEAFAAHVTALVSKPSSHLIDLASEVHAQLKGLTEGWRDMRNLPPTAGLNTQLVTDLVPPLVASMGALLAHIPAIRMVGSVAGQLSAPLGVLAAPARQIFDEQCAWAGGIGQSADAVLKRLPHIGRSRDLVAQYRSVLLDLESKLTALQSGVVAAADASTRLRGPFVDLRKQFAVFSFDGLMRAAEEINAVDVDPSAQHAAVQGMQEFVADRLPGYLQTMGQDSSTVKSDFAQLSSSAARVYDALSSHDAPREASIQEAIDPDVAGTDSAPIFKLEVLTDFLEGAQVSK